MMELLTWKLPLAKVFYAYLEKPRSPIIFFNGIKCIFEHSLSVSFLPDEAPQSAVEPEIARIGRIGSVGGSGSQCKVEGEPCTNPDQCCSNCCSLICQLGIFC